MAKKATKKIEGDTVSISFTGGESIVGDLNAFSQDIIHRLALHGLSQKLGDSYAGADDAEAPSCVKRVLDDLIAGNWTSRASASPRISMLAEALAEVAGVTVEAAIAKIEEYDDDKKKELQKHPMIASKMANLKAQRAAAAAQKAAEKAAEAGETVPALTL